MEYNKKNYKEASKYLDKVLNINPSDYDALLLYSTILNNDNKIDEALMILDKAIMINPSSGMAYYYRGFIKAFHKKGDGCLDLNRALKLGIKDANEEIKKFCK